jgi:hypothetical protein
MSDPARRSGSAGAPPRVPDTGARRPYSPPKLVEYGSVGKLTQGFGATLMDFGSMKRMCL